MASTNPLGLVFSALWTMLESNAALRALVRPGNRIKYTGTILNVDKEVLSHGDQPTLWVVDRGFRPHIRMTSSSTEVTVRYEIHVSTGEQRLESLFDVQWEVLRAMIDWETYMETLQFAGKRFVKLCRPMMVDSELGRAKLDRSSKGWSSIWAGEIQMAFTTSDLSPSP